MCHLSSQIYGVDAHIRQLVAGLPSGQSGESTSTGTGKKPYFDDVVQE